MLQKSALLLALVIAMLGTAAHADAPMLQLDNDARPVSLEPSLESLVDTTGLLTPDLIEQQPGLAFRPAQRGKAQLIENGTLWMRFDAVTRNPTYHWRLALPMPGVDSATLYYRDTVSGQWVRQRAGDTLAMSSWPQSGRYPVFMLNQTSNQATRYYLEIRHSRVPFSVLPRIFSDKQLITAQQQEYTLLGAYFGLAALVVALAMANAVAWRDAGFATYAIYVALFAGAQATFTGMAGLYLWPESPQMNNASVFTLPVATGAAAMWFVRTVTTPRRFSRALDWMLLGMMGSLPVIGLLDAVFPTIESFAMINALISASMVVLLIAIGVALVEGDRHARWIGLGFLPVLLATLFPLLRNFGIVSSGFLTEYGLMVASAFEVPVLFYGLLRRLSQRREPTARATALRTKDPLTGLYATQALVSKLKQALGTAERYPHPFALLIINFTNLSALQSQHGREAGDRAMVTAAARIRAVARSIDTVARVGDSQFALLIEGPVQASEANNIATKILASGLRPSVEIPEGEPIQFHIAVGHLGNAASALPGDAATCLVRMQQAVNELNDGSRKAIKLVSL